VKILLVAPMVPRADGPGAIPLLLHSQLIGLRQRHEVTLVTAVGDEPGEAEAVSALRADGVDAHVADRRRPAQRRERRRRRLRLARGWLGGSRPWRTVWFAEPGIQREIDRLTAAQRFDVAAVEDSSMAVYRFPAELPKVLTEHEVRRPRPIEWRPGLRPAAWGGWAFGELDWRRWPRFQREAWARCDLLQAFAGRDAEAIGELAPELAARVRVNPFGLAAPPPVDPAGEEPGTVLFVGNFTHPPNRDAARWLAGEIMPAVRERVPNSRLRLVGSSPPPEVCGLAGDGVEVIADAPSVRPHLEAASVVIAPVRIGGGMRMKVLHALASGKAVVTTTRGAEGYTEGQGPLPFFVADGAAEIAQATAKLLADVGRRRALGERAREFALAHHSPAAWAGRLEAVYAEAREPRGSRHG
jgi:glycosyltransferase involved in cell wall biosynthesis